MIETTGPSTGKRLGIAPALSLSGWTLFVWVSRIRNVLDDDELEGMAFAWRLAAAVGFVAAGVVGLAIVLAVRSRGGIGRAGARFFVALAVVGSAWWTVRGIGTLLADFSVAFKIVHTVLALVTIGLSAWVIRSVRESDAAVGGTDRDAGSSIGAR